MDYTNKKIIIADVDNTICESCQPISLEMAEQINNLIQREFQFAFISGAKYEDLLRMISSKLTEEHHLLGTTGTKYVKINKNNISQLIYNHSFTPEEKEEILAAFEKVITKHNITSLTTKEDQLQDRDSQITLSAIGRHAPSELKAQYDPDEQKRKLWVQSLREFLKEDKYEIKIAGTTSIDITRKGLDKEWGIRKFAEINCFSLHQILFFGDKLHPEGNDYPATKVVDCIAVTSPEDTLKKLQQLFP